MEYRRLGRSGLKVSCLVLGTMNFGNPTDKEESFRIIDSSIEAGINLLDCADIYAGGESEKILGQALKRNGKRNKVLLTSKVYLPSGPGPNERGNSKHHIIESCHKSLARLKTDYIDIYFLHRTDFSIPQEETIAALDMLIKQGKIRYPACSTHPAWRIAEAFFIADRWGYSKFICEQPPYNLLDRRIENEILPACRAYDMGLITWSPLGQGVLTGKYTDPDNLPKGSRGAQKEVFAQRINKKSIQTGEALSAYIQNKGKKLVPFSVSWILHQEGITGAIIGPRTTDQLDELLEAVDMNLDKEDLLYCDSLVPPGDYVSNHFNTSGWMK